MQSYQSELEEGDRPDLVHSAHHEFLAANSGSQADVRLLIRALALARIGAARTGGAWLCESCRADLRLRRHVGSDRDRAYRESGSGFGLYDYGEHWGTDRAHSGGRAGRHCYLWLADGINASVHPAADRLRSCECNRHRSSQPWSM